MLTESIYNRIEESILEVVPESFLIDINLIRGKQNLLSIKVDTDKGISLEECTKISRSLGAWFEEEEVFDFPYRLEVSSPGVGAPLKLLRQYRKNVGRSLQVLMADGTQKEGILKSVEETSFILSAFPKKRNKKNKSAKAKLSNDKIEESTILFNDIKESKVIIR